MPSVASGSPEAETGGRERIVAWASSIADRRKRREMRQLRKHSVEKERCGSVVVWDERYESSCRGASYPLAGARAAPWLAFSPGKGNPEGTKKAPSRASIVDMTSPARWQKKEGKVAQSPRRKMSAFRGDKTNAARRQRRSPRVTTVVGPWSRRGQARGCDSSPRLSRAVCGNCPFQTEAREKGREGLGRAPGREARSSRGLDSLSLFHRRDDELRLPSLGRT